MGTYTTNYNLFMPSIGEQGWGDLVNGNFSTLDSTMKGLDTRTTALESADTAFDARITTLENGEFESANIGNLTAESITGNLKGLLFVPATIQEGEGDILYATSAAYSQLAGSGASVTYTNEGYVTQFDFPYRHNIGIYTREEDVIGGLPDGTRTVTLANGWDGGTVIIYYKLSTDGSYSSRTVYKGGSFTVSVPVGVSVTAYAQTKSGNYGTACSVTVPESNYYLKCVSP